VSTPTKGLGLVYYESMKRELQTRPRYDCRCDERLKSKVEVLCFVCVFYLELDYKRARVEGNHVKPMKKTSGCSGLFVMNR
jgi:hypothetical protein